jgi:hypothetical protein
MPPYGSGTSNPSVWTDDANEAYWIGQSQLDGSQLVKPPEGTLGFSRVQLIFSRTTPAGTREDVAVTHLDWAHIDVGICAPLSGTERGEVNTALGTFFTARVGMYHSGIVLDRWRWFTYLPITTRPGPTVSESDVNYVGTATGRLPDQLAITSTYRTLSRKHWGRSYWPFNAVASLETTYGRVGTSAVDNLATSLDTLLSTNGAGGGIHPVVASIAYHGVMNITELHVDNIWDIIRRRRAKQSSYRSIQSD